jgi:hypothetical protein
MSAFLQKNGAKLTIGGAESSQSWQSFRQLQAPHL